MRTKLQKRFVVAAIAVFKLFLPVFILAQNGTLISFKSEDQFGRVYTEKDFLQNIVVIIGSDKEGSKYNGLWGKTIGDSLKHETNYQQIKLTDICNELRRLMRE